MADRVVRDAKGSHPLLSILVVTKDSLEAVQRFFSSLEETLMMYPIECVVFDNASQAEALEFVGSLPHILRGQGRFLVLLNDAPVELYKARIELLKEARGDVVVFLQPGADIMGLDVVCYALTREGA